MASIVVDRSADDRGGFGAKSRGPFLFAQTVLAHNTQHNISSHKTITDHVTAVTMAK